jgi:hypothetical protein
VSSSAFFALPSNGWERRGDRLPDGVEGDALGDECLRGQRLGLGEQPEHQVGAGDLGAAGGAGLLLGRGHDVAGAGGEPGEALLGVEGLLGHEPLLRRLLGHAHAAADVGPRGAGAARLVHEVADQVVGDLAQVVGGEDGVGELVQRLVVRLLDGGDEVVETDGGWHLHRVGHVVNARLTPVGSSTPG